MTILRHSMKLIQGFIKSIKELKDYARFDHELSEALRRKAPEEANSDDVERRE